MSSEIMELLCKTMKIKAPSGKPDQEFLAKLAGAVEKAPDDVWEGLADNAVGIKAQKWVNAYSDREDGDKSPIKMFPDWKDGSNKPEKENDMSTKTKAKTKPAAKKAVAPAKKKPAAAKKEAAAPAKKAAKKATAKKKVSSSEGGGKSSRSFVKELVAKHPNISIEEIEKKLTDKGYELSRMTIATFRNDMRNAIKIMMRLDMLKGAFDFD